MYLEVKDSVDINKVFIFIVGNKNDLYAEEQVKKTEVEDYTKSINATYRCVSALTSDGIQELFECIGRTLLLGKNESQSKSEEEKNENNNNIKLTKNKKKNKKGEKKKKCC